MLFIDDRVMLNKDKLVRHNPEIEIDTDIHKVVNYETIDGIRYYQISGFDLDSNYFLEEELINIESSESFGFIEIIEDTKERMNGLLEKMIIEIEQDIIKEISQGWAKNRDGIQEDRNE